MRKPAIVSLLAVALIAVFCVSTGDQPKTTDTTQVVLKKPDSVSVATGIIDWVSPISDAEHYTAANQLLSGVLYQPLLSFSQTSETNYHVDTVRSLAAVSSVSEDLQTFTFDLHHRSWSDGTPITTKDIALWWQLVSDNRAALEGTGAASLIDATTQLTIIDSASFSLTTATPFNPQTYISNYVAHLIPVPAHAWHFDTETDTQNLFAELNAAATDPTHELWQTSSGPYVLQATELQDSIKLTANETYDGLDRPKIKNLTLIPSEDGGNTNTTVSYLPADTTSAELDQWHANGYTSKVQYGWSINYLNLNFNKAIVEMYLRETLQLLIDQQGISEAVWHSHALPGCGPLPQTADSSKACSLLFDPDRAAQILTDNGWDVSTYPATCVVAEKCGPNYTEGSTLELTMLVEPGEFNDKIFPILHDSFEQAGIELSAKEVPDAIDAAYQCQTDVSTCDWDLGYFGDQSTWYFPVYPTGEQLFRTGALANFGGFANPAIDTLIDSTITADVEGQLAEYESTIMERRGFIWLPNPATSIMVHDENLKNVRSDVFLPQEWSY